MTLKAYCIEWTGLPDVVMFGAGESAGHIRYMIILDAAEAGLRPRFQDVRVVRCPDLDKEARKGKRPGHMGWVNTKTGETAGVSLPRAAEAGNT